MSHSAALVAMGAVVIMSAASSAVFAYRGDLFGTVMLAVLTVFTVGLWGVIWLNP